MREAYVGEQGERKDSLCIRQAKKIGARHRVYRCGAAACTKRDATSQICHIARWPVTWRLKGTKIAASFQGRSAGASFASTREERHE